MIRLSTHTGAALDGGAAKAGENTAASFLSVKEFMLTPPVDVQFLVTID